VGTFCEGDGKKASNGKVGMSRGNLEISGASEEGVRRSVGVGWSRLHLLLGNDRRTVLAVSDDLRSRSTSDVGSLLVSRSVESGEL
jgi:hypothetical protein